MSEGRRPRVAVLFGGESPEHEVSLQSAKNVIDAIDPEKWDVALIGIDRAGRWHTADASRFLLDSSDPRRIRLGAADRAVALVPGADSEIVVLDDGTPLPAVDVVFPVLHGPLGEDGTVQGLLRLAHVPFVGPGVLGSAIGMDKDVAKRLLRDAGIAVAPFVTVGRRDLAPTWEDLVEELGAPVFVKPANMGSSVGVTRAGDGREYVKALDTAFSYDSKVLLEQTIVGREIECAVLGNERPEASLPGEIMPRHDFYSYEAKYLDADGADLAVPANLDAEVTRRVQDLAIQTFQTLCCEGMARVDFFLTADGELIVNEINTIPGFTRISMYPKLWAATGVGYAELIDRLLSLALERAAREARLASALDFLSRGNAEVDG
ncbi:MAG: D-alanine--D-alanine ligase [Gemmatimonadota bacterium]